MKKALVILSAVLLLAALAIPAFAEFELTDFTIPDTGVHFAFDGNADDEFGSLKGELVGDPTFIEGRDGKAGGAIYFDDDTQYVGLYKRVALGDYTASFWVWLEDNPSYNFLCTSMEGSLRAMQNPSQEVGSTINGVVDNFSAYTAPIETWTMLTFVYSAADETTNIYANGEYVDSVYGALALPLTTIGNECAEQKGWQTYPFQAIDDTWFFGRQLSEDEIKSLYANNSVSGGAGAAAGSSNVIAHWKFQNNPDYVTGSVDDDNLTIKDLSGNGNDLVTAVVGHGDKLDIFSWDEGCDVPNIKADSALKFDNSKAKSATVDEYDAASTSWTGGYTSGKYLETVDNAPLNSRTFEKGWTVEAVYKLSPEFNKEYNRYAGILGRQGVVDSAEETSFLIDAGATDGVNPDNNNIEDTGYVKFQYVKVDDDDIRTKEEYGSIYADEWVYVMVTNDGEMTEVFINDESVGILSENCIIKCVDPSFGWEVGVGRKPGASHVGVDTMNEDSPEGMIRRLFCGTISEIRFTEGYMDINDSLFYGGSGKTTLAGAAAEAPAAAAAPAAEGYPSSGYTPKEGSSIINGEIIGLENGWDGTAASGRASAFDGQIETFFDPLGTGDGWCGVDAGGEVTLTAIVIHPRTTFLDRFNGATIEGSMDPEFENAVEIWSSMDAASAIEWQIIDQSDFDEVGSFRYYRYINYTNHGDVGEVELYGYASEGEYEKQEAARQEAAAKAAEEAAAKKAEAEAAKAAEAEAKAAEEAAKAAAEAVTDAVEGAAEAVSDAAETVVEEAKSGCGSVIGGGMIVLLTILGCGWMTSRKD